MRPRRKVTVLIVVVALFLPALLLGALVALLLSRRPQLDPASPHVAAVAAHEVEHQLDASPGARGWVRRRLDPKTATGLALVAGTLVVVVGGALVGVLAYLVRSNAALQDIDNSVAPWGRDHATPFAHDVVNAVTQLGGTNGLLVVIVVVAVIEMIRRPSRWLPLFLVVVALGQPFVTNEIKDLLDRVRPTIDPGAASLGPSFPSGHSAGAAACFAALALVLGRGRSRRTHAVLAGAAVFIAVSVAASRVLLGVHWLSDVIGGLALGWAWFALCALAFGGRLLRFGAPVEAAERTLDAREDATPAGSLGPR
ncbi:MAG TPA: phosphatase PAP2 family protein [Acidimicrobiia bacterium]|nr:phosphatase PAP2 family protein [Acidimicrobiia bacterium]